jgi:peptidoglycan/xylan/chitin deacetylase (PgdA/CDA1 family)
MALALLPLLAPALHAAGTTPSPAESRVMAITIDDLPVGPPGRHALSQEEGITERLLRTLGERRVPAIGFVNENKLEADGEVRAERVALLERWLEAGMALGNHGHSHLSLHRVAPEAWMHDVLKGERVLRHLLEGRGKEPTWFRHPFLHAGRSPEVQAETKRFLEAHGYRIAPVTIDNSEWIYADVYADAFNRGDEALMQRIGEDYVRYMLSVVEFYEGQSRQIVGEELPQTLLIHANALNADWLDELLDALSDRGYGWVDLETATAHPAYERPIDGYTGPAGITWLHRWAITADMDRGIFRGEPTVPDWIEALRER